METRQLKEKLAEFDVIDRKGFSFLDIVNAIRSLPESAEKTYEQLAFAFVDGSGKCWKTYYGPTRESLDSDGSHKAFFPDISMITSDAIAYWETRADEVQNPLLKMRYTGLVLDFKKKVTGVSPDFRKIRYSHLVASLNVAKGEFFRYERQNMEAVRHGLKMAVSINDTQLIDCAVRILVNFDRKYSTDDNFNCARVLLEELVEFRKFFTEFEEDVLLNHLKRFNRLEQKALKEGRTTDRFAHDLYEETKMLAEFYKATKQNEKIKPFIDRLVQAVKVSFELKGGLWSQGMIEKMQRLYIKYHLYKEANALYVDVRALGEKAKSEMHRHSFTITFQKKMMEEYWQWVFQGDDESRWNTFLLEYIPILEQEKKFQEEEERESPLYSLIPVFELDKNGVPINTIGTGEERKKQRFIQGIYQRMRLLNPILHEHMIKLEKMGLLNTDRIMNQVFNKDIPLIKEDQRNILKRGFDAYFAGDYIVACHLIIPQFESAIRNLCEMFNGEILRTQGKAENGSEYKSLEGLLEQLKDALGEDVATYYKVLFTETNGCNYRNLISHGLLFENDFNENMADRIVHAFLLLGQLVLLTWEKQKQRCNS